LRVRENGDVEVDVPDNLAWSMLHYNFCICRREKSMAEYKKITEMGKQNLSTDMDLIRLIRR